MCVCVCVCVCVCTNMWASYLFWRPKVVNIKDSCGHRERHEMLIKDMFWRIKRKHCFGFRRIVSCQISAMWIYTRIEIWWISSWKNLIMMLKFILYSKLYIQQIIMSQRNLNDLESPLIYIYIYIYIWDVENIVFFSSTFGPTGSI